MVPLPFFIAVASIGLAAAAPTVAHAGERCGVPDGWAEVTRRKPRYVVFGEIHGTAQSPAFIGTLACALTTRGERVLVAVELSSSDNDALQAAWRLPPGQFPEALHKTGLVGRRDGVGSVATRDMIVRLHALKSAGRPVSIVAFNGARDSAQRAKFADQPGQGPHEAAQAENIRNAAAAGRYDHVLVLVGNLHARKEPIERDTATFRPMAMQLAPAGKVMSLNMATAGGSAWTCELRAGAKFERGKPISSGMIECAGHPVRSDSTINRAPFVAVQPLPGTQHDPAYDGWFWLGTVTASPAAALDR
ncbi:hypothetical protein [Sphingomonas sp. Leaf10]|uniref:hypothetical protein n=1 Tax=Sphingomonas sp. Leaf10 TaxID=1735676 RepID=UPI000B1A9484|nr:hypothetical protein [Sphingomonas sp. Leaf10]